jgi:pantothenate kinase
VCLSPFAAWQWKKFIAISCGFVVPRVLLSRCSAQKSRDIERTRKINCVCFSLEKKREICEASQGCLQTIIRNKKFLSLHGGGGGGIKWLGICVDKQRRARCSSVIAIFPRSRRKESVSVCTLHGKWLFTTCVLLCELEIPYHHHHQRQQRPLCVEKLDAFIIAINWLDFSLICMTRQVFDDDNNNGQLIFESLTLHRTQRHLAEVSIQT